MKAAVTESALIVRAPSTEKKSSLRFWADLPFDVRETDAVPRHQKFDRQSDDQKRRHVDRENLQGPHEHFLRDLIFRTPPYHLGTLRPETNEHQRLGQEDFELVILALRDVKRCPPGPFPYFLGYFRRRTGTGPPNLS